jgi:hypothetical protein
MLQALGAPPATAAAAAAAAAGPGLFDGTRRWHVFDNLGVKRWLSGSTLASSVRQGRCDEACQWLLLHAVSVHLGARNMPGNFTAAATRLLAGAWSTCTRCSTRVSSALAAALRSRAC